jgi:hypothetical protein
MIQLDLLANHMILRFYQLPCSSPDRFTKNLLTLIGLGESRENVIVKFIEGSMIRLRDGSLISIGDDDPTDLREVFDKHPLIAIERVITRPE